MGWEGLQGLGRGGPGALVPGEQISQLASYF